MNVGIIHLSDLHIKNNSNISFEGVVNAIRLDLISIEILFIVFSGDLAFSGEKEQYIYFDSIVKAMVKNINIINPKIKVEIVSVPGNHDCNFKNTNQAREICINNIKEKGYNCLGNDDSIVNICTNVQDEYFEYLRKTNDDSLEGYSRLYYHYTHKIDGNCINFNCYNTAWLSKQTEDPGSLFFPIERIPGCSKSKNEANISIAIYHHPDNWQSPDHDRSNHIEFRNHILRNSQIVLTGHEHVNGKLGLEDIENGYNSVYLESNYFHNGSNYGSFNYVLINDDNVMSIAEYSYDLNKRIFYKGEETVYDLKGGIDKSRNYKIKEAFKEWLEDTAVLITHEYIDSIKLSDIFVFPKFEYLDRKEDPYIASTVVLKNTGPQKIILFGAEQSGKSAFLKKAYGNYYYKDKLPLYLDCSQDIKNSNIRQIIKAAFNRQYRNKNDEYEEYVQLDRDQKVLLIDNIHSLVKMKEYSGIINALEAFASTIWLTCIDLQTFDDLFLFNDYEKYSLLPFGAVQRDELIKKWLNPYTCSEEEKTEKNKHLHDRVNDILGTNLVPPYPIYITTILQALEAGISHKTEISSYGHCYQTLIYLAMKNVKIVEEMIETYYNLLSNLSYYLYSNRKKTFTLEVFKVFLNEYRKNYLFDEDPEISLSMMTKARIIYKDSMDNYSFKYLYIYYYFVAKHLADTNDMEIVKELCKTLEKKDSTFILLFLTHHSKNIEILNEIVLHTMYIFEEKKAIKFIEEETLFMNEITEEITKVVLQNIEPEEYRNQELAEQDKLEIESRKEKKEDKTISDMNANIAQINKAFKSIDINGQILKNRSGSIKIEKLEEIIVESYLVSFRLMTFIINEISNRETREALVDQIIEKIKEDKRYVPQRHAIEKTVLTLVSHIIFYLSHSILEKTAFSIGTEKLVKIYDAANMNINTPAADLLTFLIHSKTQKSLDIEKIKSMQIIYRKNTFAIHILRRAVVQYLYMNKVDYRDKQRIVEILGIPIDGQRKIENKYNRS